MRKSMNLNESPYLPVRKVQLYTPDGSASNRMSVMLDMGDGEMEVGSVSRDYTLVPNREVEEIAQDVLVRSGLPYAMSNLYFDGKHFRKRWVLPELTIEPRVGDIYQKVEEDNWWGLYNAFTDVLSHANTFRGDVLNRQVSRYFLERSLS